MVGEYCGGQISSRGYRGLPDVSEGLKESGPAVALSSQGLAERLQANVCVKVA